MSMIQENAKIDKFAGHGSRVKNQEISKGRFKSAIEYRGDFLGSCEGKKRFGIPLMPLAEAQRQR